MRSALFPALILFCSSIAHGHGDRPRATELLFVDAHPDVVWVLTDSQGIYANLKTGFRWLCEDAVAPSSGVRGLHISGNDGEDWVVATTRGLFRSTDGGCDFVRIEESVGSHRLEGLWRHPLDGSLLTASSSVGYFNDVYRSVDEGQSWEAAGLGLTGRVTQLLRAPSDPLRVYLKHSEAALRSEDGGLNFEEIQRGAPVVEATPGDFRLLAVHPIDSDVLFASAEAIPTSLILKSDDGGRTWLQVHAVDDLDLRMVMDRDSDQALLIGPLTGMWRSMDGGVSWAISDPAEAVLDCLTIEPDTGRLWSCTDVYDDGPWVAAHSADFGQSWTPVFEHFTSASERWDCEAPDRGTLCCNGLCPGLPPGADCGRGAPADPALCEQPDGAALLPLDGGAHPETDGGIDGSVVMDAGHFPDGMPPDMAIADAALPPMDSVRQGGCAVSIGFRGQSLPVPALFVLAAAFGLIRRRTDR
jgi:photosystem II stability/assembly factor-like uncharacterized protein